MPGSVFRRGETVELWTVETDDVAFLRDLVNDPEVRAGTAVAEPLNGADERSFVESIGDDGGAQFLICVDADPVGIVGVNAPDGTWGTAELGYQLVPDAWGNGYATDAAREACGYAFESRRLHKLSATVFETNPASARVLEKVGFTEEGRLREEAFLDGEHVDVRRFGLLADEWFDGGPDA